MASITEPKRDSMDAAAIPDLTTKLDSTKLKSINTTTSHKPPTLATLPPSIRNKIYSHVLDTELVNVDKPNVSYTHTLSSTTKLLHFQSSRPPFPVSTALFYVDKTISEQARRYFYAKNLWVKLALYTDQTRHAKTMLQDSGVLFSVAAPELVEQCGDHALDVVLVEGNSSAKKAVVLFPAQYLPRLVNFMQQASLASGGWAGRHALFLTLRKTYGEEVASVQGDLLEGFRVLVGMGKVVVEGDDVLDGYAEGLQESTMAERFEVDAWLACLRGMFERSQREMEKGRFDVAVQQCKAAVIALTFGYFTHPEELHSQPEAFQKSVQHLRYEIELSLAVSLMAPYMTDFLTSPNSTQRQPSSLVPLLSASTHVTSALSLATDSPTPSSNPWVRSLPRELIPPNDKSWFTTSETAKAWAERGKCHLILGEALFAAGDLERAERLLSDMEEKQDGDEALRQDVTKWFAKARESIDWNVRPGIRLREVAAAKAGLDA